MMQNIAIIIIIIIITIGQHLKMTTQGTPTPTQAIYTYDYDVDSTSPREGSEKGNPTEIQHLNVTFKALTSTFNTHVYGYNRHPE